MLESKHKVGTVLAAVNRDPLKYEWYKVVSDTTTKIDLGNVIMELSKGEKFGLKITKGKYFIIDASDLTKQYAVEDKFVKRLLKRSQGFRGKIDGIKVVAGKETGAKPKTDTKPKADAKPASSIKRRPKPKPEPEPEEDEFDLPDDEPDDFKDDIDLGDLETDDEPEDFEAEDPEDTFLSMPKARGRIRKRMTRAQLMEEDEQEETGNKAAREQAKEPPKPTPVVHIPSRSEITKNVKVPRALHPPKDLHHPALKKVMQSVQALAIAMMRKETTLPKESRKVLYWINALSNRAAPLEEEFAVKFPVKRKWPTRESFQQFTADALKFAHNRTVTLAVDRIEENLDLVLGAYADFRFQESAWRANILKTETHIEEVLESLGFAQADDSMVLIEPELSLYANQTPTKSGVELTVGVLESTGDSYRPSPGTDHSLTVPVGKNAKSAITKLVNSAKNN